MTDKRRPISLLPQVHQTTALTRFFGSTVDHLFQPGSTETVSGYIGRKPSYYNAETDFYKNEINDDRQNYQLEAAMVSTTSSTVNSVLFYDDLINRLSKFGAEISDASRLFETKYYSWQPPIDIDKSTFFQNYYWSDPDVKILDIVPHGVEEGLWITGDGYTTHYSLPPELNTSLTEDFAIIVDGVTRTDFIIDDEILILNIPAPVGSTVTTYRYGNVSDGSRTEFNLPDQISAYTSSVIAVYVNDVLIDSADYTVSEINKTVTFDVAPVTGKHITVTRIPDLKAIIEGQVTFDVSDMNSSGVEELIDGMRVRLLDAQYIFIGYDVKPYEMHLWDEDRQNVFLVEGVGNSIKLIPDNDQIIPYEHHYVVIDRRSEERSFWTKVNRWVHRTALEWSGDNTEDRRAKRPIVEFNPNLALYNYGFNRITNIDGIVTTNPLYNGSPVAFSTVDGRPYGTVTIDGNLILNSGQYILNLISGQQGLYKVEKTIDDLYDIVLQTTTDGDVTLLQDTVIEYWKNGSTWVQAQERSDHPLFDLFDSDGVSLADIGVYPSSDFEGSKLFSYAIGAGSVDPVLDIPLEHDTLGKIVFENYHYTQRYTYADGDIAGYYYTHNLVNNSFDNQWHLSSSTLPFEDNNYAVPLNLQANPDFGTPTKLSRNDWFEHFASIMQNQDDFEGVPYGTNNWQQTAKDPSKGLVILQHHAPLLKLMLLMSDDEYSVKDAIEFVEQEYVRFKLKYIHKIGLLLKTGDITETDTPSDIADAILASLNAGKSSDFPFSNSSIGGSFDFIPPSPSAIGVLPLVTPALVTGYDGQYVRGHDGSLVKSAGTFIDSVLLELENRMYDSSEELLAIDPVLDITTLVGGKFRDADYTRIEHNDILRASFEKWARKNSVNYRSHADFDFNDPFTYNYSDVSDRDGEAVFGNWRGIYRYYFDTETPNLTPWEMLGFSEAPAWWNSLYGAAPYARNNNDVWNDIEAGIIQQGPRAGTYAEYARPNLRQVLPVDNSGNLLDPIAATIIPTAPTIQFASREWTFGDCGPVESLWRKSSSYRFALALSMFLMKPAKFVEGYWDFATRAFVHDDQLVNSQTLVRDKNADITIHRNYDAVTGITKEVKGIQNWIVERIISEGRDHQTLQTLINGIEPKLAHKMGGFTTQDRMTITAENFGMVPEEDINILLYSTPNVEEYFYSGVLIEKTNYGYRMIGYNPNRPYFDIIPSDKNGKKKKLFSTDEKVINVWKPNVYYKAGMYVFYGNTVFRCDKNHTSSSEFEELYWTLDTVTAYNTYAENIYKYVESSGFTTNIPYGHEFRTKQEVINFIYDYERWLLDAGFIFEAATWDAAVENFYGWSNVDWAIGAFITISPAANELQFNSEHGFVLNMDGTKSKASALYNKEGQYINPDFSIIDRYDDKTIIRAPNLYGARIQKGEVEHILIFNNRTIFDDLIYDPLLNLRQSRLKMSAKRSSNWVGRYDAPGFMIQGNTIIPNFEKTSDDLRQMYDIELADNTSLRDHARHLIGFQKREYLSKLLMSETQQFEMYQGMIQAKGTVDSFTKLLRSTNIGQNDSELKFLEEWAFRLNDFGAYMSRTEAELVLRQSDIKREPQVIHVGSVGEIDWLTITNEDDRWLSDVPSFEDLNGEAPKSAYPLPDAGYVRVNEVTFSYTDYDTMVTAINSLVEAEREFTVNENIWIYGYDLNGFQVFYLSNPATGDLYAESFENAEQNEDVIGQRIYTSLSHTMVIGDKVLLCNSTDLGNYGGIHVVANVGVDWFEIDVIDDDATLDFSEDTYPRVFKLQQSRVANITERNSSPLVDNLVYVDDAGSGTWAVYKKVSNSWVLVRSEPKRINNHKLVSALVYDKDTVITKNSILPEPLVLSKVIPFDPLAGLIQGVADKEIDYKIEYDPAVYITSDASLWGKEQLGQLWWNLSTTFYLNYYTDDIDDLVETDEDYIAELNYRSTYWGRIAPNSSIDIYEWTANDAIPETDDPEVFSTDYIELVQYDYRLRKNVTKYYYWRKKFNNDNGLDSVELSKYLANPTAAGAPWMAIISKYDMLIGNIKENLGANSSVLQIKIQLSDQDDLPEHQEWELLQPQYDGSLPTSRLWNKMRDSLRGFDDQFNTIPFDSKHKIGIELGQSLVDPAKRAMARESFITMLNYILARHDYSSSNYSFSELTHSTPYIEDLYWRRNSSVSVPNIPNDNFYDVVADTPEEMEEILAGDPTKKVLLMSPDKFSVWTMDGSDLAIVKAYEHEVDTIVQRDALTVAEGERVLVKDDDSSDGFWTIWEKTSGAYVLVDNQTYRTEDFWDYSDWYAEGYSPNSPPTMEYPDYSTRNKKENPNPINNLVKITDNGSGFWVWTKYEDGIWKTVAKQDGTYQFKESFWKNDFVFGLTVNEDNLSNILDRDGSVELGIIINSLFDNRLITDDEINELWFTFVHFVHSSHDQIDWAFKTSFLSILGLNERLTDLPVALPDISTHLIDYIDEVKPYRVTVRDFQRILVPDMEIANIKATDFDKPFYFDEALNEYRRLTATDATADTAAGDLYRAWLEDSEFVRKFEVGIKLDRIWTEYVQLPDVRPHDTADAIFDFGSPEADSEPYFRIDDVEETSFMDLPLARSIDRGRDGCVAENIDGSELVFDRNELRITDKGVLIEPISTNMLQSGWDLTGWTVTKGSGTISLTAPSKSSVLRPAQTDHPALCSLVTATANNFKFRKQVTSSDSIWTISFDTLRVAGDGIVNISLYASNGTTLLITKSLTLGSDSQFLRESFTQASTNPWIEIEIVKSGDSIIFDRGQAENLSYATSWIAQDSGAFVSRNQDSLHIDLPASYDTSDELTIASEIFAVVPNKSGTIWDYWEEGNVVSGKSGYTLSRWNSSGVSNQLLSYVRHNMVGETDSTQYCNDDILITTSSYKPVYTSSVSKNRSKIAVNGLVSTVDRTGDTWATGRTLFSIGAEGNGASCFPVYVRVIHIQKNEISTLELVNYSNGQYNEGVMNSGAAARIMQYYEPTTGMRPKDLEDLLELDFKGTIYDGSSLADLPALDIELYGAEDGEISLNSPSSGYRLRDPYHGEGHPQELLKTGALDVLAWKVNDGWSAGAPMHTVREYDVSGETGATVTLNTHALPRNTICFVDGVRVKYEDDFTLDVFASTATVNLVKADLSRAKSVVLHSFGFAGSNRILDQKYMLTVSGENTITMENAAGNFVEVTIDGTSVGNFVDNDVVTFTADAADQQAFITLYEGIPDIISLRTKSLQYIDTQSWGVGTVEFDHQLVSVSSPSPTNTINRFDPVYWTTNFPSTMIASLTTDGDILTADAEFHKKNDLVGIIWESEDIWDHKSIKYETNKDYTNCVLSFNIELTGSTPDLAHVQGPVMTIEGKDALNADKIWYVRLFNYKVSGTDTNAVITLDFDNLSGGWAADDPVYPNNITKMFVGFVPLEYDNTDVPLTGGKVTAQMKFSNVIVTGTNNKVSIGQQQPLHDLRMTNGYDDTYNLTPARIVKNIRMLGYRKWFNHYVGMSHYMKWNWDGGESRFITEDAVEPLNGPCVIWHTDLSQRLKENGYQLILSLSYEMLNSLAIEDWRQLDWQGNPALTGWSPPSTLLSPCNTDAMAYLQKVAVQFSDIAAAAGQEVHFQVGEPWYWVHFGTLIPYFYDSFTTAKYLVDTGLTAPVIQVMSETMSQVKKDYLDWLGLQLSNSTAAIVNAVTAEHATMTSYVLVYLPQILNETAPEMHRVNMPVGWAYPAFDILQIEDYDFVIDNRPDLQIEGRQLIEDKLLYPRGKQQYFAGFVLNAVDSEIWEYITDAIALAHSYGINDIFVWAYTQVMRDSYKLLTTSTNEFSAADIDYTSTILEVNGMRLSPPHMHYADNVEYIKVKYINKGLIYVWYNDIQNIVVDIQDIAAGTYNTISEVKAAGVGYNFILWEDKVVFNVPNANTTSFIVIVYEDYDYIYDSFGRLNITKTINEDDVIRLTTFTNNQTVDMRTWHFLGEQDGVYTIQSRAEPGASWVTVNGIRQVENIDYVIREKTGSMWDVEAFETFPYDTLQTLDFVFNSPPRPETDHIVITTFEERQAKPPRVWQLSTTTPDIVRLKKVDGGLRPYELVPTAWQVDYFDPLRMATTLTTDITNTSTSLSVLVNPDNVPEAIYSDHPVMLPDIENGIPGVIWVRAERIEYFDYSRADDVITLMQLRRGTKGSPRLNHDAGTLAISPIHGRQPLLPKAGIGPVVGSGGGLSLDAGDSDEGDTAAPIVPTSLYRTVFEGVAFSYDFNTNEPVTWSIVGGVDQAQFTLNSDTGLLEMTAKDYDNPIDNDANNTYLVTVRATDTSDNFAECLVTVEVLSAAQNITGTLAEVIEVDFSADGESFANNDPLVIGEVSGSSLYSTSGAGIAENTPHRYWRITGTNSYLGADMIVSEVEFHETVGGVDVCNGGTAFWGVGNGTSNLFIPNYSGGTSVDTAFDNDVNTKFYKENLSVVTVGYDFGAGNEKNIVEVKLTNTSDWFNMWHTTTLEYSDDGTSWVNSGIRDSVFWWTDGMSRTIPDAEVASGYYRAWSIEVLSNNGNANVSIADIEMRATVSGPNIATGGRAQTGSLDGDDWNGGHGYATSANAFDGLLTTEWTTTAPSSGNSRVITYVFSEPVKIEELVLKCHASNPVSAMPKDFKVYGHNDGTDSVEIASITNQTDWSNSEEREYLI